jgi:hypothetical protein
MNFLPILFLRRSPDRHLTVEIGWACLVEDGNSKQHRMADAFFFEFEFP